MIDDNRKNLSKEDYQLLKDALRDQTQNWDIEWQWDQWLKTEWKDIENWVDSKAVKDFQSRILKIENEEKNVWKVAWKKVSKSVADSQQRALESKRERLIEEIWEYYWLDQYEAVNKYDELRDSANVNNVKYQVAETEYEYLKNRNDLPWESYLMVNQIITRINWWENIKSVIKDTLEWRERMLERYERILKNWDETWDYWVIWEYQLKRQIEKYKNDISVLKTMDESDFWKKAQDPLKSIAVDKTWQKSLWQQVNELRTLWLDEATIDKYVQDVIANPEKAEKITINTMKQAKNYIVWQEPKKWAENVRVWLDKPKWWWTESEIRNTLKNIEADKWTDAIYKAVNEYDDVDDFMAHAFYHGTAHYFAGKPSITLSPSEAVRLWWGWYWERYYAISLSKSKKIASNFWSQEAWWWVSIYPVLLKKNAKVIELPKTTDSIDLNDFITKLWDDWIDAVWIWDKNAWEQELAILNPKAIVNTQKSDYYKMFWLWTEKNPINIKNRSEFEKMYNDVKNATTEEEKTASANNIMYQKYWTAKANEKNISAEEWLNLKDFKNNRTVQEIADQYWVSTNIVDRILTPEWQRALWVYQNWGIELAKTIKESTAPHELLHATFDLVDNSRKSEILNNIQKRLDVDEIQAEEWLADNFSEYYRTGKFDTKAIPTTLVWKIKQFFQQVKEFVDWTYAERKQIQNLFDDILEGKDLEWGKGTKSVFQSAWDIYSNNFKNWFWDWENDAKYASKVVDKNWDPLVVYHWTPENFTEFKKDMIWANYWQDNQWFFFTDDKAVAQDYADTTSYWMPRSEKWNVMEVYLDIKNPLVKKVDYDPINLWDNNYEKFLNEANKNWNDWIIIKADKWQSMYVPFEPEQIKSATDNVWTFDKNNPDIRYQFDTYSNENRSKVDNFWGVKEDNWVKYIESAWKPIYNKKKDWVKQRTWDQHQFTNNYIFSIPNELNWQLTKLSNFIRWNDEWVQLGNHYLSRDVINHIYENHWPFALENLIMTLNKYDDIVKRPKWHEDVNYLLKKIPWSNNFFRATIWKNWVVTFFERVSWWEDLYSKDLAKWQ